MRRWTFLAAATAQLAMPGIAGAAGSKLLKFIPQSVIFWNVRRA